MFEVVDDVHELFGGQHSFYFRDDVGTKKETFVEEMIKNITDFKKMVKRNILISFINNRF